MKEKTQNLNAQSLGIKSSVIIIAAGRGKRMAALTNDKPKCMLKFGDKTLLQHQQEAYSACGIKKISVVRGYKSETIDYHGITYFENTDYENNNILVSLMCAEQALNGHVICAYSDILFSASVVQKVLESTYDISIVVDVDWRDYYEGRENHPLEEAENIIFDETKKVISAGKIMADKNDIHGEFIGMIKFTPSGAEKFKQHFHSVKKKYKGKSFQRANVFEQAYLTDIIQDMADEGIHIHCVTIERGWKEIDTIEDYEKALENFEG